MNDAEAPLPLARSLRGKGYIATLVLLAYVLAAGLYVAAERGKIMDTVRALDQMAQHEKLVALTEASVNSALVDVNLAASAAQPEPAATSDMALYMERGEKLFAALEAFDPAYALLQRTIQRSYEALAATPLRANWIDLRAALQRASDALEIRRRRLVDQRGSLAQTYQRQDDAVTVESLLLAIVGLALFGSMAAWFFSRLAGDIHRLEAHARQIVRGARGIAVDVRRDDELGRLMHAVNRMAVDLDEREKQIAVDNQRRSHHDKMLTVGALAAGIAHEVNNPLMAITGTAQALRAAPSAVSPQQLEESAQMIIAQAERAARAARQLADVATPEMAEPDWIDLNAMVRRVVRFTGFDRRYRHFSLETALDVALPAVRISGDAVQQVLMQMLTVACDAMVVAGQLPATLRLTTAAGRQEVEMRIELPPVLDFTRPEVQRALLLCRAIIEPLRGRLAFDPGEGPMLRFRLTLPAVTGGAQQG
jgi:signal transduction histidine kinase